MRIATRRPAAAAGAFTLVETLIVVAIIALLLSLLVPAMRIARISARIVRAHSELRGIEVALHMYADTNAGTIPPTRFSCNLRSAYELPIELGRQGLLPEGQKRIQDSGGDRYIAAVQVRDVFDPNSDTYKYRAVGPAILNESTLLTQPPNCSSLWVPDTFPDCSGTGGRYYFDIRESPVRYAIWSIGPDPQSPKFVLPGRMPIPNRYWCYRATDTGVITHFQGRDGKAYMSR